MTGDTSIAIVVPTRNRPESVARTITSILKLENCDFELCVIDQSDSLQTVNALSALRVDPRLRVIRTSTRGVANARNTGVASTHAPLVAFVDDDCEVHPGWLDGFSTLFAGNAQVGVAFGSIVAGPYDREAGLVVARPVGQMRLARHIREAAQIESLGACMAIRRSVLRTVGGFDPHLGPGAPFLSAEDTDICIRTLLAGFWACETPDAVVTHHGFHVWAESEPVVEGYLFGVGAAYAKMVRLAGVAASVPLGAMAWRWLAGGPVVDLNHRPSRLVRLRAFLRGAWMGLRVPLDAISGRFLFLEVP